MELVYTNADRLADLGIALGGIVVLALLINLVGMSRGGRR